MRVQSQPIVTGYSNNNTPAFKSAFLYSPRSPLHKINPVLRFMDYNFERSLQASRSMWFAVNKKLAPYVTIVDKTNNKFNTKMWDINKNNTKYLIIMHGLSHNITSLQTLYQEILDKTNYAVLAPEYNGFEQNSKENVYLEPKNLIKTTDVAIQYLNSKGIKDNDIYILGHSFGGYVAAACAKKHQNIGGLILLSSINTHKHWADAIKNGHPNYVPHYIQFLVSKFNLLFNTAKCLKKVSAPVDIIHGRKDKRVKPETAEYLAKTCKNLHSLNITGNGTHSLDAEKINIIINLLNNR